MNSKSSLFKLLFFLICITLYHSSLNGQPTCDAPNPAQFLICLTTPGVTTINVTTDYTEDVDLTTLIEAERTFEGVTINIGTHILTLKGNMAVNELTQFDLSSGGILRLKNNRNETVTFVFDNPIGLEEDIDDLNTALDALAFPTPTTSSLHAVAISLGAGVLPVTLNEFNIKVENSKSFLTWQTSTELNNAKFIIQTSTEGEIFNNIGEIAGAGTTTEPKSYSFTHQTPSAGANYYRLKQVDFDGTFAYSKVLAINAPGSNDIFAFPNPAKDKITLQYDYSKGEGSIQLFDALGRRLKTNIGGYAGNYEVVLPEGLAKGTYWLKVERAGKVQTVPVVKE